MSKVRLGLCGLGTVGSGVVNVMQRNGASISARSNTEVALVHVGARRDNPNCELGDIKVSRDIFAVVRDPEVDVVLELVGGTEVALELVREAIANNKHVVTANKAMLAEWGNELMAEAEQAGVCIAYEAAVAGGIPIVKAIREGLAGNEIQWLAGIINGTGNFILSEMNDKGREFADALKEAQALGYAEADPALDVEGIDAAHKLVILASIAFGMPLQFDSVFTEGISGIEPQDVDYAEELGYRIKHLGVARRSGDAIEMRVHPALIPNTRLLANVDGVKNAVLVEADAVGSTLYCGAGAGAEPTASAVLADVVDIARALGCGQQPTVSGLGFAATGVEHLSVLAMQDIETAYYLRLLAEDKPGVMSEVSSILSGLGISIEALIQKPPQAEETKVPVIVLTNRVREGELEKAVAAIEALDTIVGSLTRIRVEALI